MKVRFFLLLAWACCLPAVWGASAPSPRPHLVVFLGDDHSQIDSEVYGNREVRTPNMRRLAANGLVFTHAFVASPSCAPSRAALLTGLMPPRNGAEANHSRPLKELKKLPAYLQELGYEVVAFGKVSHYQHTGDYGFDHFAFDRFHQHQSIPAALKFLRERNSPKPLCLFIGSNWPHVPWPDQSEGYSTNGLRLPPTLLPTPETQWGLALYYSAVSRMDQELGQVLDTVQETLGRNTVIVQTSDHGAQLPFAKWNCYDAGIRVPLIVSWPGVIKPGRRTNAMVSWVDLLPTLVEAAGGTPPTHLDGRSFVPVLRGKARSHRDRIFATHQRDGNMNNYPQQTIRTREWQLIQNLEPASEHHTHIDLAPRENRPGYWGGYWNSWTNASRTNPEAARVVARYHKRPEFELYDLRRDPWQTNNLAQSPRQENRVQQLRTELEAWRRAQGARAIANRR